MEIDRPLIGYVVVEVDYHKDREEPIHSFVSSPFATRDEAVQEREKREDVYRDHCDGNGELYDEKSFSVTELKIHSLNQLQVMDEDRYETLMGAVNAVGESLLADEGIGPLEGETNV